MDLRYKHSYFKWDQPSYQKFMVDVMNCLCPRRYFPNETIYDELAEISEFTFVESGSYYIGYEINRVKIPFSFCDGL